MDQTQAASILRGTVTKIPEGWRIHKEFQRACHDHMNKEALYLMDGTTITFSHLDRQSDLIARNLQHRIHKYKLQKRGQQDKIVAILMTPSWERIAILLAIFKAGLAYVPLPESTPLHRIRFILREAKPLCVICSAEYYLKLNLTEFQSEGHHIFDSTQFFDKSDPDLPDVDDIVASEKNTVACVLYTSGSAGTPKGVRLTHGNILNRIAWQWRELPFEDHEIVAAKTSAVFVDSLAEIWGSLLKGIPLVIIPKCTVQNPMDFLNALADFRVSRLTVVPSLLGNMLAYIKHEQDIVERLQNLRVLICSGEPLVPELAQAFFAYFSYGKRLANFYDSTEVTGDVTYDIFNNVSSVVSHTVDGVLSIGKAVDNCCIYIVGENLATLPQGQIGQIVVSGESVTHGYLSPVNREGFSERKYPHQSSNHVYMTGDYGLLEDGLVYYHGRRDSSIQIAGQRVNTLEIELALLSHASVDKAAILVYHQRSGIPLLIAFYSTRDNSVDKTSIETHCQNQLPAYMIPKLLQVDSVPLDPETGKTDREKLRALFLDHLIKTGAANEHNSDALSAKIFSIVSEELGLPEAMLRRENNFFEIGGNSISAVTVLLRLRDNGIQGELTWLLHSRNMIDFVDRVKTAERRTEEEGRQLLRGFRFSILKDSRRKIEICRLLANAFVNKEPIALAAGCTEEEFYKLPEVYFEPCVDSGMSIVVTEKATNRIVACSLSLNVSQQPNMEKVFSEYPLRLVGAAMNEAEKYLHVYTQRGKWLNLAMEATDVSLSHQLNLKILEQLERQTLEMAVEHDYDGIASLNTNHVTISIGRLLGYKSIYKYRTRDFELADGSRPLWRAATDAEIHVTIKYLKSSASAAFLRSFPAVRRLFDCFLVMFKSSQ